MVDKGRVIDVEIIDTAPNAQGVYTPVGKSKKVVHKGTMCAKHNQSNNLNDLLDGLEMGTTLLRRLEKLVG